MRHEYCVPSSDSGLDRVERLCLTQGDAPAEAVLEAVFDAYPGEAALVSSFGADAAVLLHMIARLDRTLPVLMVDTLMLFPETMAYQRALADRLGLSDVRHIRADNSELSAADPHGTLHQRAPDACCSLRKVVPLERALSRWPAVITGRKRFQASTRASLPVFEMQGTRLRVNPLAAWSTQDLGAYMDAHDLPRHPLVARRYPSIGCAPCTTPVGNDEDARAGRWRGTDKVECGIHIGADGRVRRTS